VVDSILKLNNSVGKTVANASSAAAFYRGCFETLELVKVFSRGPNGPEPRTAEGCDASGGPGSELPYLMNVIKVDANCN
jgi:hypothetical protein